MVRSKKRGGIHDIIEFAKRDDACLITHVRHPSINGKIDKIQRQVWRHYHGEIKDRYCVWCTCHKETCVNIHHLRCTTRARMLSTTKSGDAQSKRTAREGALAANLAVGKLNLLRDLVMRRMQLKTELTYRLKPQIIAYCNTALDGIDEDMARILGVKS